MNIHIAKTAEELGIAAADKAAIIINDCIAKQGHARIVLSTGASQFTFLEALAQKKVDWSKVEMFHLDEYVDLAESHPASFRLYLRERFLSYAPVRKAHLVNGEGDVAAHIAELTEEIGKAPIDLALIGIGENAHIAFNDPPADFDTTVAYKVVDLDDECKAQQVREGWFESLATVPTQAITMSVQQILKSKTIISCVPHQVKANAIQKTLQEGITNLIPASILKSHEDWELYLDEASASGIDRSNV
ncbi:6-phosphogluconolactonase [Paenibacillus eucommiae]|uniref:Glucosamine-6-phosphate deaminase n=1 Tax=Paenibacillus eucommiae TaxID=1355755 RepID=A0ABS4ITF8_9BACL|nr:6-phosphogluconolactonase [Paenibacillus eucommiae]MBP1990852.1 glucosamine-6-phosphate deaminase [Paenibacillus eucommiae]